MSIEWLKDWEARLTSTGQLAAEREAYRVELIRLGESETEAAETSSSYVPDPKMLGQAAHVAGEMLSIKRQAKAMYGDPVFMFTLPSEN